MSDSLRDQLLGLGFKPAPKAKPERPPARTQHAGKGRPSPQAASKRRPARDDIDLAKAYAIRAQKEKDERIEAERVRQEEARLRREARSKLDAFLKDKVLNVPDAEIARHFPYGGKIKRVYVTPEQLKALNAGQLGVVQQAGRYLLVAADVLAQAGEIFAPAIALKVDPDAPVEGDPYADPRYQVPDDLVW